MTDPYVSHGMQIHKIFSNLKYEIQKFIIITESYYERVLVSH